MIYYFHAITLCKNLGQSYNSYMDLLKNDEDWACFTDADSCFFNSKVFSIIDEVVSNNQHVGLFTCLTNRVGTLEQCYNKTISEDPNLINHYFIAANLLESQKLELEPINKVISGMMMLVKKSTWLKVGKFTEDGGFLGVDNDFSQKILNAGLEIKIMKGVYIYHYYRHHNGITDKSHLL